MNNICGPPEHCQEPPQWPPEHTQSNQEPLEPPKGQLKLPKGSIWVWGLDTYHKIDQF